MIIIDALKRQGGYKGTAPPACNEKTLIRVLLDGSLAYSQQANCDHHSHDHGEPCGDHGCGHDHGHGHGCGCHG